MITSATAVGTVVSKKTIVEVDYDEVRAISRAMNEVGQYSSIICLVPCENIPLYWNGRTRRTTTEHAFNHHITTERLWAEMDSVLTDPLTILSYTIQQWLARYQVEGSSLSTLFSRDGNCHRITISKYHGASKLFIGPCASTYLWNKRDRFLITDPISYSLVW
jgi:hypothetical protein